MTGVPTEVFQLPLLADLNPRQKKMVEAEATIDVINPATEAAFTQISAGSAADVDRAVEALEDGAAAIFDYKAGQPPGTKQIGLFSHQLHIQAAILMAGYQR